MKRKTSTTWKCFQCEKTIEMKAVMTTRDGGQWHEAPPGWLFVKDGSEDTYVCSTECVRAIYSKND